MALALASWFVTLSQQKQYNYHMGRLKLRSLILADLPISSTTAGVFRLSNGTVNAFSLNRQDLPEIQKSHGYASRANKFISK